MQKTEQSKRINLIEHEHYSVELEYTDTLAILHLPRVDKFTKTYYLQAKEKLEDITQFLETVGYQGLWVAIYPEDELTNKFVKKLNFEFIGVFETLNVYHKRS